MTWRSRGALACFAPEALLQFLACMCLQCTYPASLLRLFNGGFVRALHDRRQWQAHDSQLPLLTPSCLPCRVDPASVETQVAALKARLQAAATAAAALPAVQPEK